MGAIRIPDPFVSALAVTGAGSCPALMAFNAALLLGPKILLSHAPTASAQAIICLTKFC